MKLAIASVLLCLALTACAALQTLSTTQVPVKAIIVAGNGHDVAETAATAYVRYCLPNPMPAGCNADVIRNDIKPAIDAARTARNAAEQFVADNPDATFGPSTLVDAVTKAVTALQTILAQNNKGAK